MATIKLFSSPSPEPALSARRSAIAFAQPQARTRVGNGSELLAGVDGRTAMARRYKEHMAALVIQIEGASRARITDAQMMLARRAALLSIYCEESESKMANGQAVDMTEFVAASSALRRLLIEAGAIWPAAIRFKM